MLVAGVAIFGMVDRSPRARIWMGLALGIGLALIVDEAALLVTLEDVYWETEGWPSVALALALTLTGLVGTGLALDRGPRECEEPGAVDGGRRYDHRHGSDAGHASNG